MRSIATGGGLEPLGSDRVAELIAVASTAYRKPLIGREFLGLFRAAGLRDVQVGVLTADGTNRYLLSILLNMASTRAHRAGSIRRGSTASPGPSGAQQMPARTSWSCRSSSCPGAA